MVKAKLNRQNHTKKHTHTRIKRKQTNKQERTVRTLGQMVKANLDRQNHATKHRHTHSQKEKKGNNIYRERENKKQKELN